MPRFGGPELSAELLKHWPDLPVLFISGYTDLDSVSRGLVEAGRELLQKPIEPQALARKVRAMLEMAGKAEKAGGQ
jgi:FixJ family two-component response regulator